MENTTIGTEKASDLQSEDTNPPQFDWDLIKEITSEKESLSEASQTKHEDILSILEDKLKEAPEKVVEWAEGEKIQRKHYVVCVIEEILASAKIHGFSLCRSNGQTFIFNGAYWKLIDRDVLQDFFGRVAESLGVPKVDARHYVFKRELLLQFESAAYMPKPESKSGASKINFLNGTLSISREEIVMGGFDPDDFLTYQLNFPYDPDADCAKFADFLNVVLPDSSRQNVLQEFIGWIFIPSSLLKLEKVLLAYGTGANGKSVLMDILAALLGKENVCRYSLQSLTATNSYTLAFLGNSLLNICSETSSRLDNNDIFKLLASGEEVGARHIYGKPFTMTDYAKLMFSANELPKDVEQTAGFFRRWLIIPFDVTIPEDQQDKELSSKIISTELPGVFNWVITGLRRLLIQRRFSESDAIRKQVEQYKRQSDSVTLFLDDENYQTSIEDFIQFKDLFFSYKTFCVDSGYHACSKKTFGERLRNLGYEIQKKNYGLVVMCAKSRSEQSA